MSLYMQRKYNTPNSDDSEYIVLDCSGNGGGGGGGVTALPICQPIEEIKQVNHCQATSHLALLLPVKYFWRMFPRNW